MRILVLGSTGMVGHIVSQYLVNKQYDVYTFSRRPSSIGHNINGDIRNTNLLDSFLSKTDLDFIINCIGILNNDCDRDPENAIMINSWLPHHLVNMCKPKGTRIIQISTDCVFSGLHGSYIETSIPDGCTLYARTKALGEITHDPHLSIRTSIIGPDINPNGTGLFNWFMKQRGIVYGYSSVLWTGITSLELSKAIDIIINNWRSGIVHLVNGNVISKMELIKLFNRHFRNSEMVVVQRDDIVSNKTLINSRDDLPYYLLDYEIMMEEMLSWILEHRDQYWYELA